MNQSPPRMFGERIFSLLAAFLAALILAACGGGGGGDTSTPGTTPTANPDPTPTNPVVRIASAIGCDVQANQKACDVTVVADTSVPATAQIVGGLVVAVAAGTGTEVKLTSVQVGSNTVLLSVPGTTGTPAQTTVSVQCAPGLTLDTTSGECRAPVVKRVAVAVYGQWAIPGVLEENGITELRNTTTRTFINCAVPKTQTAPFKIAQVPGICTDVTGSVAAWVAVYYDLKAKTITLNPGGDTNTDNFMLSSDQIEVTVTLANGKVATFFRKEDLANLAGTKGDIWVTIDGVSRLILDVVDIFSPTEGSVNLLTAYDVVE